ncbi:hypothetical protein [Enterobacter bugandensis]|uniref:hypothetical protein n=1 Tax=Enterobacter bugandensis TaxID=881260 RepID=UPI0023603F73|nr:hypothetical protein [Enterobacter bugandensis]
MERASGGQGSNIDKHAVQAVADLKAGYILGHADVAILNELARIALASLEATHVGYIDSEYVELIKSVHIESCSVYAEPEEGCITVFSAPPATVVPDGWVAVPIVPTFQMCEAVVLPWESPPCLERYKAMIAAAPRV